MKVKILFFLFSVFVLTSCSDGVRTQHLDELTRLQEKLNGLNTIATAEENQYNPTFAEEVQETIELIKDNIHSDTISIEMAENLEAYQEIETALSINSRNLAKAKQAIPELEKSLTNLKHDIEKGVNDRDKYQEYINFEKERITDLENILAYYLENKKEYEERFGNLHPIIRKFAESLRVNE